MKQPLPRNEKEAPRVSLQEPQDSIDKAAQPEQPVGWDGSSAAAELQEKMKAAAKEFNDLLTNSWILSWDASIPRGLYLFTELSQCVQCTPKGVFYSYDGQWIRVAREYMRDPGAVEYLHKAFKKYGGKVSWTLPRIKKGGAAV